ncbi:hypothetical protein KFK09_020107 [Dendrobium nobile]|uniref:Uncharacterized protein n=1 Tax=Dendrobium nobile TaxID=94219 RepID=A0A8T3AYG1_DENNO|nr:hypothetical protein KFK09_020107 [Dendrobium nobile]
MTMISVDQTKKDRSISPAIGSSWSRAILHSQVIRIREEDLRIGEGTGEGSSAWDHDRSPVVSQAFMFSRPVLPSPLGLCPAIGSR